ncbi:MAG: PspC domain-containing protein [Bacteroidales bacterium]|nr:PspC domain-containing protein [Bacteroidales bacterium]MBP3342744.1 PspC domain-containing protein [Bacteroidales bacterium]MBQ3521240.1 PspC domain-containing protein [Bacteroidales bacterium]MBQ5804105.1 PspC domain-containing protein [Bacteroidales bacterium]MBQ6871725.1 PspC domain-containing protein [Bacteroidales bacterium]
MEKKLVRIAAEKKLGGVCAGLARYFGMDVSILRIAYVILTIITGSLLFWLYLILWFVLPQE